MKRDTGGKIKVQMNNTQMMFIASFAMALIFLAIPLVLAEKNASAISTNSPSTEGNDDLNESVSSFDINMAKVGLWFTFNQEKKAEKELNLARMELIRARNFAKNNNTEAMEKAFEAHNRILEKVQQRIKSLDGKATKEGAQKSAEGLIALSRAIEVHELRLEKFRNYLENNSNLTEQQRERIERQLSRAENNTAHLREVQDAKEEKYIMGSGAVSAPFYLYANNIKASAGITLELQNNGEDYIIQSVKVSGCGKNSTVIPINAGSKQVIVLSRNYFIRLS